MSLKPRVEELVETDITNSIPDNVADRRQPIDMSDSHFNGIAEVFIRENVATDGVFMQTQNCTGAPVEIEGFQLKQPGLLFMTAAHCDTEALLGKFHAELKMNYLNADGEVEVFHVGTKNMENMWFSDTYGPYEGEETDGIMNGSDDFALIYIPTDEPLPPQIKPFIYSPAENSKLFEQHGKSLMIPTAGVDGANMRVDTDVSVDRIVPGKWAKVDAHAATSTSGAPVLAHENGKPITDEKGRVYTLGPLASFVPDSGFARVTLADPKIFKTVPFLTDDPSYTPSSTLLAENSDPEVTVKRLSLLQARRESTYGSAVAHGQPQIRVETVALTDTEEVSPIPNLDAIDPLAPEPIEYQTAALTDTDGEQPIEYVSTAGLTDIEEVLPIPNLGTSDPLEPEPIEYQTAAFDYTAPTGIAGIDAVRDSLKDDDVLFSVKSTDRGYVISDASEFDEAGTAYANVAPGEELNTSVPATFKV